MSQEIAIVGLSCRLPMAPDREALWRLLRDGRDAIAPFPAERLGGWSGDPATLAPAGFIDGVADFDADLFGVSPREAIAMDPQQRLALELAWEGLEDAGHAPLSGHDGATGVFVGMMYGDYADVLSAAGERAGRYTLAGQARAITANRVSRFFGFDGPSMVVDSGQSSSLVAVHLACESLRTGESRLALAAGVNLILSPESMLRAHGIGALSPEGRAYVFDARANGFVRGEGGAVAVLKRLADAVADGDRIHGVIHSSAVSSGTGESGITAPSAGAQERVIRAALRRAQIEPADVGYVELHGTGTRAGDPVEAAALGRVYGAGRAAGERLAVGSIKTNVGHLEGAAGIAGLLKAALCAGRGELVASLNFEQPNPAIALDELGLRVVVGNEPWPEGGGEVAGVSSFGMGGTNCHLLLSAGPQRAAGGGGSPRSAAGGAGSERAARADGERPISWIVSGHDDAALRAQAGRLSEHVEAHPELDPVDVGWSLATTRAALRSRAVVVGADRRTLLARLGALARGEPEAGVVLGSPGPPGEVAFVFPGQGSQWPGMAVELWRCSRVFAESIEACAEALSPFIDWSLEDVLRDRPGAPPLERVDVVQPVMFAMAVSLAALWRAHGVEPSIVLGHSQGEVAAAHVAGALSLSDAACVAAMRGRTASALDGRGGMVSVLAGADEVQARIDRLEGLTISVYNGPGSVAVSGELEPLHELLAQLEADGVRARLISGAYASHGPQAELVRDELHERLADIEPRCGEIAFCSAVTAGVVDGGELDAGYWFSNLRQPVRFEQATRALVDHGATAFVELSPHPVLTVAVEGTLASLPDPAPRCPVIGSLRREEGGPERFAISVGEAHARGIAIDHEAVLGPGEPARVDLPPYAFQRRRFWVGEEPEQARAPAAGGAPSLAGLAGAEREAALLEVVVAQAASVLGHGSAAAIDARRTFRDMGFDSLAGVELRTRLAQATGLELPATLVFDHPTPQAVARLLGTLLGGGEPSAREVTRAATHSDEPIAIVGMSCRYPGGVTSAHELWELVAAGTDAIGPFPSDRGWELDGLFDPDPDARGHSYVREGGFLHDAPDFDAAFFSIAPREASAMDPQQRVALQTAWAALEDAAIDPRRLAGSATGVFLGVSTQDYGLFAPGAASDYEGLRLTGSLTSVVSGRVSYALGLQGPGVTLDTACSSSLVALHLACQALRGGECSLALAGGVTVLSSPELFVEFSRQRGLAADGRSKAFAAGADGVGWAEGAGVLVVERLSDARRLGHRVLGLVRGSAINQDGASNGLSAPNGPSQEQVIRQSLANAGLSPGEVDAVEGHGTGTPLGDPIEVQALLATYGLERTDGPLRLGSIKSNIGHAQAAAGVAGIIKMLMAMRAELLPRTLHAGEPSSEVDWSAGEIALLSEAAAWPRSKAPRRAGVSSFGISGTNAHVVLEEAPASEPAGADSGPVPLVLSARTETALRAQARRLRAHLDVRPALRELDAGWTLAAGRARLEHRAVIVGGDRQTLLDGLDAVAAGEPADHVATGSAREPAKVAFVFAGQGSQWRGMALDLWADSRLFAEQMRACSDALSEHVDWDLREVLQGAPGAPALERMDVVQPASFAVFVSLAALWRQMGVEPSLVVGHSQGEIAAAHVAGALSLDDAARVAALRSRALVQLAGAGGMLSLFLPADEVGERIERWGGRLSLASYNSPRSTVVSGEPAALAELQAQCEAAGERARMIAVDYASHSAQIEAIEERLLEDLRTITPVAAAIPIVSTTTAALIDGEKLDAAHWYRNLREPVRFEQATRALLAEGVTAFVETSPHPVLTWAVRETVEQAAPEPDRIVVVGSLRRDEGGRERLLTSVGEAHAGGVEVDWEVAFAGRDARRVELPTYPFEGKRFWVAPGAGRGGDRASLREAGMGAVEHPLLGAAIQLAGRDEWLLSGRLSLSAHPWLADHELFGEAPLPAAAFAEIALRAAAQAGCDAVDELVIAAPLVLDAEGGVQLQVTVGEADERGRRPIEVHGRPDGGDRGTALGKAPASGGGWTHHATGTLAAAAPGAGSATTAGTHGDAIAAVPREPHEPLGAWPPPGAAAIDVDDLYDRLAGDGYAYGPAFQAVRAAWQLGEDTFVEVALGEQQAAEAGGYAIHPVLLDAALHPAIARRDEGGGEPGLAFSLTGVRVRQPGAVALRARIARGAAGDLRVTATDEHGEPLLSVDALATRAPRRVRLDAGRDALHRVRWRPAAVDSENGASPRLAALGDVELPGADRFADLAALLADLRRGAAAPSTVLIEAPVAVADALALLQDWLAHEPLRESRLALLTDGAVAALDGERPDPGAAAILGLLRSAQAEHPGRFVAIDAADRGGDGLARALAAGEPEVALRDGAVLVPRLTRATVDALPSGSWRLAPERAGALIAAGPTHGDGDRPLRDGEVRLAIRAAGVNARDVRVALGVEGAGAQLGIEGAGVVTEVGPGVSRLAPGDRVMGFVPGAFGPLAVADGRLLVAIPAGWSFARAAAVPVARCTALRALVDLAELEAGERVLIHAAAGGVGMAAVALARRLGAEVFATASPWKWDALRELGIDDAHLASSRTAEFAERFAGIDVVLNCLPGELVDASLGLLSPGGRFVELGAADVRDPAAIATTHPGVRYEAVDLLGAGPQRLGELLAAVADAADLAPPPVTAWDVRDGSEALRFLSQARNVGKLALTIPRALDRGGCVLVTGGIEGLGAAVAEHLARAHGVEQLVLAGRRGPDTPGSGELVARLSRLDCEAELVACDVGDRASLAGVLAAIDPKRPLTAVVHAAGTFADATIESLDAPMLEAVMRPKAQAARWLDELTAEHDLAAFVLFSSAAGLFGFAGQGNYAAANAGLDALAQRRRAGGLPATAVAWGVWEHSAGMTSRLTERDIQRLRARTRQHPMGVEQALALLDAAIEHREARLLAAPLDLAALRAEARGSGLPALLSELVRAPARDVASGAAQAGATLPGRLAAVSEDRRAELVLGLVRAQVAAALGHDSGEDIEADRSFSELGFDSLGSIVLRNRLVKITGLRLPSSLVFDHPTPVAMARFLRSEAELAEDLAGRGAPPPATAPADHPATPTTGLQPAAVADARIRVPAPPEPDPAGRRYGGGVLSSIARAIRGVRFGLWILRSRARLARLGCRLAVECDGIPRLDGLPRIAIDRIGEGRGSLTLRIGRDVRIGRELTLDLWTHADGVIEIAAGCQLQSRIRLQPWGGTIRLGPSVQVRDAAELKSRGELVVGAATAIGRNATIHCHERIELSDHVALAEGVGVMDSDHTHDGSDTHFQRQPILSSPVLVERNVFVGTNALILRGSRVGRNAVIATGAVLTGGDYPPRHLLAGVPASALRPLGADEADRARALAGDGDAVKTGGRIGLGHDQA